MTTRLNNHCFFRWHETGRISVWGINGGLQNTCAASDGFIDNKIDRSDAVFKLLRLWVDINGDGTAGTMETFTLSTMKFKLADGLQRACHMHRRLEARCTQGRTRAPKNHNTRSIRWLSGVI